MQIVTRNIELRADDHLMRTYVAAPRATGQYPAILFYSDIYLLGGPVIRLANHLAGYGYVVAAPEIFYTVEKVGTIIEPDDIGRMCGNDAARRTPTGVFDAGARTVIEFLKSEKTVLAEKLGTMGFCIGGHLAFRAALQPEIKAAVCCYPTGLPSGKLGVEKADTLTRVSEIQGEMLIFFGARDNHTPPDDRKAVAEALQKAATKHRIFEYEGEHAFMRDDGYRYDPVLTDKVWAETDSFLKRSLG